MTKPLKLAKRYNADDTVSLICRGRVVFRSNDLDAINSFVKGFYGDKPIVWNRPQFSKRAA